MMNALKEKSNLVLMVPVKNERLFRSLLLLFVDWHSPVNQENVFDLLGYFLTIINSNIHPENKSWSYSLAFSGNKANEIEISTNSEGFEKCILVNIEDDENNLMDCLMLLKEYRKDGIFKRGRIESINQKCAMEILISQSQQLISFISKKLMNISDN